MNPIWQAFLQGRNATIEDGRVIHYRDPVAELVSAQSGTVMADLSHLGLIGFSGEDAQSFLQGQLTCDVRFAGRSSAVHGGYCTPKGRLLASFLLWQGNSGQENGGYLMQLPLELQPAIRKRLAMYVLRAKVKLADRSDAFVRIGIAGNNARTLMTSISDNLQSPGLEGGLAVTPLREGGSMIHLADDRFELILSSEFAEGIWQHLSEGAIAVGAGVWDWLEIKDGIPTITAATQEQFVPQMVNLDVIGGVSFQKGCYPGQEIVARSKYLGKIKRRMYLAHLDSIPDDGLPQAGDELFSADMREQSSGTVVNAAASPEGGFHMLAVLQTANVERGSIRWRHRDGPVLEIVPLPYSMPDFEHT